MGTDFSIRQPGLVVYEPGEVSPTLVVETQVSGSGWRSA